MKPLLAARREEASRFDTLFDAYWLRRGVKRGERPAPAGQSVGQAERRPALGPMPEGVAAIADSVSRETGDEAHAADRSTLERGGASKAETVARTDFRHLDNPDDLALLDELVEKLALSLRRRLQRRRKAARRGERLDLRRMLHASIPHGGEPIEIYRKRARRKPLRPVLLLDASGSMSQYSAIFLRFMLALLKRLPESEGYLFHTRLVEIGPVLRERRRVKALERLSLLAEGWGGGTRIGECLATFAKHHAAARLTRPVDPVHPVRRLRHRRARGAGQGDGGAGQARAPHRVAQSLAGLAGLPAGGGRHGGRIAPCRSVRPRAQSAEPGGAGAASGAGLRRETHVRS